MSLLATEEIRITFVSDSGKPKQVTAEKNPKSVLAWLANEAETSESESRAERSRGTMALHIRI